jgi:large subunit ribosomal protein L18
MCVVKTNRHIFVQLIDDEQGKSVAASSTLAKEFKGTPYTRKNKESAKAIGENIAEKAKSLGINRVIFDRGPFKFHGILAELANAARASGLQF